MNFIRSCMVAAGVGAALMAGAATALAAGVSANQDAPNFTLTDIEGRVHSLQDFRGKTVVLEWVNPECPFVVKHYESGNMPRLQKMATDEGVIWLLINSGSAGAQGDFDAARATAWMDANSARPTAYFRDQTGDVGRLYGAKTTPHMYVINPYGVVAYEGAIDSIRSANQKDIGRAENYVVAALEAVQDGRLPVTSNSQPYGCSVKY